MTKILPFTLKPICSICNGKAVHEECYVLRMLQQAKKPPIV